MPALKDLRVGFVPYSPSLQMPGDRRRFASYAQQRGIRFELADPRERYDVVVLSERADISVWCDYAKGKIVYDLIDSYLAIPRSDLKGQLRGLAKFITRQHRRPRLNHWRAIEAMCRRADAVVCTTAEQKCDIEKFCSNVRIILDNHSAVTRRVKTDYRVGKVFQLVWEGLPATLDSLWLIRDALHAFGRQHAFALQVVTDPFYYRYLGRYGRRNTLDIVRGLGTQVTLHEWNETTCADIICGADAAIIPLDLRNPFAAGKPENKLLLFWRMGMPAVVSASPAYARAMAGAGLDTACTTGDDWCRALESLVTQESARAGAGRRGRAYADAHFSAAQWLARWDAMFESILTP
jgi:hypothetical protein